MSRSLQLSRQARGGIVPIHAKNRALEMGPRLLYLMDRSGWARSMLENKRASFEIGARLEIVSKENGMDRRTFLPTAVLGALASAGLPKALPAAEMSDAENANVKVVSDMVATWDIAAASDPPDIAKLRTYFAEDCAFRLRPTDQTATRGLSVIEETMKRVTANGQKVQHELLDRFARGPVVAVEKLNHFVTPEKTRTSHVVAVFILKDGKIAEWTEYFMSAG